MSNVLLITGGSRGIGAETARLAARRGYAVCINYRSRQTEAEALVSELRAAGADAVAVQADVSVESEVVRLFTAVDDFGTLRALVNNAGTLESQCRLEALDMARLTRVFSTNVYGAFLCAREAMRRMSERYGGAGGGVVNVSSLAARTGSPGEYIDYAASKGALDTMTVGLAREVAGEGVRVNGVRPGFIDNRNSRARWRTGAAEAARAEYSAPAGRSTRRGRPRDSLVALRRSVVHYWNLYRRCRWTLTMPSLSKLP